MPSAVSMPSMHMQQDPTHVGMHAVGPWPPAAAAAAAAYSMLYDHSLECVQLH